MLISFGSVYEMITKIGEICEDAPCVGADTVSLEVDEIFKRNPNIQGIVILEDEYPIALVMRVLFYQKIGDLYGYNLYMGRPIKLLMNQNPLIVDSVEPIIEVSQKAMERPPEEMYDYVIVTENNQYKGIVSIQNLLLTFANIQSEKARFLDPLTGLPGNHLIEREFERIIRLDQYSVLYIDLDNFKAFNDIYGFKQGDDLILATAEILKTRLRNAFVGHIGGDDFVACTEHFEYESICKEIINDFDKVIQYFYTKEHWEQQYVVTENRAGISEKIPLVSISIAIVSNQMQAFETTADIVTEATNIKRICKKQPNSCYIVNNPTRYVN